MSVEKSLTIDATTHMTSQINDADILQVGTGIQSNSAGISIRPFADGASTNGILFKNAAGTLIGQIDTTNARMRIGDATAPTGRLDLLAGTNAIPPIRLGSGPVLTAATDGSLEYNGTNLYFTIGTTRHQIAPGGTLTGYTTGAPDYSVGLGVSAGVSTQLGTVALGYDVMSASTQSSYAIGIGYQAGKTNAGENSINIGLWAGFTAASGAGTCNIAIGSLASYDATEINNNIAIGNQANYHAGDGNQNICIGLQAGFSTGAGVSTILIGEQAGYSTIASYGVGIGYQALYNPHGLANIAIGYHALYGSAVTMTAAYNVAIGYNALDAVTTCSDTIALGREAGGALTVGVGNTLIGQSAGAALVTTGWNAIVGHVAGTLVTGASNAFFGAAAGSRAVAVSNSTFVGQAAGEDSQSSNSVFVGFSTGFNSHGNGNIAIGYNAFSNNTQNTAANNIAIGLNALDVATICTENIAIGSDAGGAITTGSSHIMIGLNAGLGLTTGGSCIVIGQNAGSAMTTSSDGILIGTRAGSIAVDASNSICIGVDAGRTTNFQTICIGVQAGYNQDLSQNGGNQIAIGTQALYNSREGTYNVTIGQQAGYGGNDGSGNILMGYQSGYQFGDGSYNVCLGWAAGRNLWGGNNVAIGYNSMLGVATGALASNCVALGSSALDAVTTGADNIAIGSNAGGSITTSASCVAIGKAAMGTVSVNGLSAIAIGDRALALWTAPIDSQCCPVAIGRNAFGNVGAMVSGVAVGNGASRYATDNTVIGDAAFSWNNASSGNVAIGMKAQEHGTTVGQNIAIGDSALAGNAGPYVTDTTIAIGYQAAKASNSASGCVVIGHQAMDALVGGTSIVAIGFSACGSITADSLGTVAIGLQACLYQSGARQTAVGYQAMRGSALNSPVDNTAVGYTALTSVTTGAGNTALGSQALLAVTDGFNNVALGALAGRAIVSGYGNICVGEGAGRVVTGNSNTFVGDNAGAYTVTASQTIGIGASVFNTTAITGTGNIGIGTGAGGGLTSGDYNLLIGNGSGSGITQGTSNVCLGTDAGAILATAGYSVCVGYHAGNAITGANCVSIGKDSDCGAFNDSIAIGNTAIATATGAIQIGTGSNGSASTLKIGQVTTNPYTCTATSWGAYSDERVKKDIVTLTENAGLSFIKDLNPVSFKFKVPADLVTENLAPDATQRTSFGLIAQQVKQEMDARGMIVHSAVRTEDDACWSLDYNQFIAPLIKAVQELSAQVVTLQNEVAALKKV